MTSDYQHEGLTSSLTEPGIPSQFNEAETPRISLQPSAPVYYELDQVPLPILII